MSIKEKLTESIIEKGGEDALEKVKKESEEILDLTDECLESAMRSIIRITKLAVNYQADLKAYAAITSRMLHNIVSLSIENIRIAAESNDKNLRQQESFLASELATAHQRFADTYLNTLKIRGALSRMDDAQLSEVSNIIDKFSNNKECIDKLMQMVSDIKNT